MGYPLDLNPLKQSVEEVERLNLNINLTDLTIEQKFGVLKTAISNAQDIYNLGIENNKEEFNALVTRLQEIGNDLYDRLVAISGLSSTSIEELLGKFNALKDLIESDTVASIISTIDTIADEVNARLSVSTFTATISDNTGIATVNISSLGLSAISDYRVQATADATSNFVFTQYACKKVDKDTVQVKAFDSRYVVEDGKLYDGSTIPAVFSVQVTYLRPNISIQIVDSDGDNRTVGN